MRLANEVIFHLRELAKAKHGKTMGKHRKTMGNPWDFCGLLWIAVDSVGMMLGFMEMSHHQWPTSHV